MAKFAVILPAAGRSSRFHDQHYKKPFVPLANKAVWLHAAEQFVNRPDVKQMIMVISPEDLEDFQMKFAANTTILGIDVVEGGDGGSIRSRGRWPGLSRTSTSWRFTTRPGRALPTSGSRPCLPPPRSGRPRSRAIPVAGTLKRVGAYFHDGRGRNRAEGEPLEEAQTRLSVPATGMARNRGHSTSRRR